MRTFVYEITTSEVDSVTVGSLIVDTIHEPERRGEPRVWHVLDETTGSIRGAFAGLRLDEACTTCFRSHHRCRPVGHTGEHGDGPHLVPRRIATTGA